MENLTQEQLKALVDDLQKQLADIQAPVHASEAKIEKLRSEKEKLEARKADVEHGIALNGEIIAEKTAQKAAEEAKPVEEQDAQLIISLSIAIEEATGTKTELENELAGLEPELAGIDNSLANEEAALATYLEANSEAMGNIEDQISDASSLIVTSEDQVWENIAGKVNEMFVAVDGRAHDDLDETYFVGKGIIEEVSDSNNSNLESSRRDYSTAKDDQFNAQSEELRHSLNEAISGVFQESEFSMNDQMKELFTENTFAQFISSGKDICSFYTDRVVKAIENFDSFEDQLGNEGNESTILVTAYSSMMETNDAAIGDLGKQLEVVGDSKKKANDEHDKFIIDIDVKIANGLSEIARLKDEVKAQTTVVENSYGSPEYVAEHNKLMKLMSEELEVSNTVKSHMLKKDVRSSSHGTLIHNWNLSEASISAQREKVEADSAETIDDLKKVVEEYKAHKASEEEGKAALVQKHEEKIESMKNELKGLEDAKTAAAEAFKTIKDQYDNAEGEAKTALADDYLEKEQAANAAEFKVITFGCSLSVTDAIGKQGISQFEAEIESMGDAIKALEEIVPAEGNGGDVA